MAIDKNTLFTGLSDYYRQLQSRRWQCYATLLVFDGLLLNAWKDFEPEPRHEPFLITLSVGAVFIFVATFRLLSRVRHRINVVGRRLNELAGESILDTESLGPLSIRGNTFWLYVSVLALSAPWFVALWQLSTLTAVVVSAIYIVSLVFVRWTLPPSSKIG